MKILIIGNGYVGNKCAQAWPDAVISDRLVQRVDDVLALLDEHKPEAVLNAAGVVGKPNVDWCESHQQETMNGNVLLPIIIADACRQRGVYLLHIGSGCIYYGESPDPLGWKEDDFANPAAVYTKSKYSADLALCTLPNVGIARIRMPLDSVPYRGNIIDKLVSYDRVIDVENSLTVVEDMITVFRALLEKKAEGIFHVTNPGTIKHKEIIALYQQYVDPALKEKTWITEKGLVEEGLAVKGRSTNKLQSNNLEKFGIKMRPAAEAVEDAMKKYAVNRNKTI